MSAKNFIKENFVLVMGLALPVLLMIFFMLSTMIPTTLADPPKYSMIFSVNEGVGGGNGYPFMLNLFVKDGHLYADYQPTQNSYMNYQWKTLYLFDAATQNVRNIPLDGPETVDDEKKGKKFLIEETKHLKLDTNLKAPDGYEFYQGGYSSSGLVNDIFWGGGHNESPRLRKGSATVKLPPMNGNAYYPYYGAQFIGWVVP